jgi:hypothetical protein
MVGITEKLVLGFIEKKLETERPKIMEHLEGFVKEDMKTEIIDELGELITNKFEELEKRIESIEKIKVPVVVENDNSFF